MEKTDKLKKIIIITIIIIIAIIITIVLFLLLNKSQSSLVEEDTSKKADEIQEIAEPGNENNEKSIENEVKELSLYKLAENKINAYINDIYEESDESVYNILNKQYIEENNITTDNVLDKMEKINTYSEFYIDNIIENNLYGNYEFYIEGKIKSEDDYVYNSTTMQWELVKANNSQMQEQRYIIRFDFANLTYDIKPVKENTSEYNNISIEENDYNTFEYKVYENYEKIGIYLEDFKVKIADNKLHEAYLLLDEEYRNKKFSKESDFVNYVQANKEKLTSLYATKYKTEEKENYIQYTIIDNNKNYYIIREYAAMDYKILLDSYTTDIEDVSNKYQNSSKQEKVGININKFINAINQKDYTYAYKVLDSSFKENYYKTQVEFENYVKNNFYNQNNVEFDTYNVEGENHIYKIILKNSDNEAQAKNMTIVMQLKEGTDFVMSFSMQ